MHYNLLFNGCSWTYGADLEGPEKNYDYQKNHRYSHLVSTSLNMSYENISNNGISNDRIVEKTIEWFEEGNTCDFAIVQFTIKNRTIWYDDINLKEYDLSPKIPHKEIKPIAENYYKNFYSDFLGYQNLYKNIFFLEKYFNEKKIQRIYTKIYRRPPLLLREGWKKYVDIKIKNIYDILGSDFNSINYQKSHPSAVGHQKIANFIIEEIKNAL